MTETTPIVDSKHTDQSIPYEWSAYEARDETIVTHSTDSPTADSYRVAGVATNPDAIAEAEAVLYEGSVLEPVENEGLACIDLHHFHGGRMHTIAPEEEIEEPVVLLERLEHVDEPVAKYEAAAVDRSAKEWLWEGAPYLALAGLAAAFLHLLQIFTNGGPETEIAALLSALYILAMIPVVLALFMAVESLVQNGVYRR